MNITEKKENHPLPLSRQNHILKALSKAKRQKENIFLFKENILLIQMNNEKICIFAERKMWTDLI